VAPLPKSGGPLSRLRCDCRSSIQPEKIPSASALSAARSRENLARLRGVTVDADTPETLALFHAELELVERIARQLMRTLGRNAELDDLRSYGREGLLSAARRFDPSQAVPFRGYATFRVRGAMIDGIRKTARLPRRIHEKLRCLEAGDQVSEDAAEDAFREAPPGDTQLDAQRRLDDHLAKMATAMALGLLHQRVHGEEGEVALLNPAEDPETATASAELHEIVTRAIAELPHEEAELVRRHYYEGERFDHVAEELGLSKSWASRLHTRAIARLTKRLQQRT
jgi:RNA polymerase sigma factor FliA